MYRECLDMVEKLATFRIDEADWANFQQLCKNSGTNASKELLTYIKGCLEAGKLGQTTANPITAGSATGDIHAQIQAAIAPVLSRLEALETELGKEAA